MARGFHEVAGAERIDRERGDANNSSHNPPTYQAHPPNWRMGLTMIAGLLRRSDYCARSAFTKFISNPVMK